MKEGKVYAADNHANRLDDNYFPILKIMRKEEDGCDYYYATGQVVSIYKNGSLIGEVPNETIAKNAKTLFGKISDGSKGDKGSFEIPEIGSFLEEMRIQRTKAPAGEKADLHMQIHDIRTGFEPVMGYSIKSDLGNPPTLLNAGKNTRFRFEILGIDDHDMEELNAIDKSVDKKYMKTRMGELFKRAKTVRYDGMHSATYESNLVMLDSMLPEIYGNFILYHYMTMQYPGIDCKMLCGMLESNNPLGYKRSDIYTYKIKKLLSASALGMMPGKEWDGTESATGGYLIVRRDGDVVCYHVFNRDYFEEYLLNNTMIDRPSASRHDYGYVYKKGEHFYIDLNIQIRFKPIKDGIRSEETTCKAFDDRIQQYAKETRRRLQL